MKRKYQPTKDIVIALLATTTILAAALWAGSEKEIEKIEADKTKLETQITNYKKEMKLRDDVLDNKRRQLDDKDKEIKALSDELGAKKQEIIKKDSAIKELQQRQKEFPTQVKTKNPEKPVAQVSSARRTPGERINLKLTFYGDFAHENGGYAGMDAQGNKLVAGTIASNVYPFGTQFVINGQTFTVRDRGGKNFNSSNRLDVFVPRMKGEGDESYSKRISNYGVKKIVGYKL